jgi:hypothetical protein
LVVEFFHFFGRSAMICALLSTSISFADEVRKDFLLHKQKMESLSEDRESGLKDYLDAKNKAQAEAEANRLEFLNSKKATRNQRLIDREKTPEYYQDQKAKKEYDQSIRDSVKEYKKNKLQQNANMAPIGHDAKTEAVEYGLVPPADRIDLKKRQLYTNKKLAGPSGGMGGSGSFGGGSFGGASGGSSGGGYSGGSSGGGNYSPPPPPPPVPEYFDSGSDFPPPPPPPAAPESVCRHGRPLQRGDRRHPQSGHSSTPPPYQHELPGPGGRQDERRHHRRTAEIRQRTRTAQILRKEEDLTGLWSNR